MRRLLAIALIILIACGGLLAIDHHLQPQTSGVGGHNLTIYNWGDYIDPFLIHQFERKTGIKVDYQTFDSNEAMLTKVRQGGTNYDLVVPSEYMVARMQREHLLAPLDHRRLPQLKSVDPAVSRLSLDPHYRYAVPYFWGTLGIVYNDQKITETRVKHWRDLWQPSLRQQVMLVDSARDVLAIALFTLNDSINTRQVGQLNAASRRLEALAPNVKAVVADEMKMYLEQGEAAVGVTYSGEAREMMTVNHHLHYLVPSEGSNVWFDNLVIPKNARHKKAAYQFINFMLEPRHAAQNARYIGYATPVKQAKRYLPAKVTNDPAFYPTKSEMRHLHAFKDLPLKTVGQYNDRFLEFKMVTR